MEEGVGEGEVAFADEEDGVGGMEGDGGFQLWMGFGFWSWWVVGFGRKWICVGWLLCMLRVELAAFILAHYIGGELWLADGRGFWSVTNWSKRSRVETYEKHRLEVLLIVQFDAQTMIKLCTKPVSNCIKIEAVTSTEDSAHKPGIERTEQVLPWQ